MIGGHTTHEARKESLDILENVCDSGFERGVQAAQKGCTMQRKGTDGSKGGKLLRADDNEAMQAHVATHGGQDRVGIKFTVSSGKRKRTFTVTGVVGKRSAATRGNRIAAHVASALTEANAKGEDAWGVSAIAAILNVKPVSGAIVVRGMTATDAAAFLLK